MALVSEAPAGGAIDPAAVSTAAAVAIEADRNQRDARELAASESCSHSLFDAAQTGLMLVDATTGRILDANPAAAEILAAREDDLIGRDAALWGLADLCDRVRDGAVVIPRHQSELRRRDGNAVPVILAATAFELPERPVAVLSFMDISDLTNVQKELRQANRQLEGAVRQLRQHRDAMVQSEKLASIGQLAAGVAHEINNPISYVMSNLATIARYVEGMRTLLELYRRRDGLPGDDPRRAALDADIRRVAAAEDLDFALAEIDGVLRESMEGAARVAEIVRSLRSFARDESAHMSLYDLNDCVESMVRLVWNELKYSCRVEKDLGEIPLLAGRGGQINQVLMNILVNAAHAIGSDQGTITIRTRACGDDAVVEISDTGCGMTPATVARIFEPFYTTKDVDRGTGLGLAVSHGIVADHGGRIEVESAPGAGSTFRVVLPLPARRDDVLSD